MENVPINIIYSSQDNGMGGNVSRQSSSSMRLAWNYILLFIYKKVVWVICKQTELKGNETNQEQKKMENVTLLLCA